MCRLVLRGDVPYFGDVGGVHVFAVCARFVFGEPIHMFGVGEQVVFADVGAVASVPDDELVDVGVGFVDEFGREACLVVVSSRFVVEKY